MLCPPSLLLPVNEKEAIRGFQINLSLSVCCVLPKSSLHIYLVKQKVSWHWDAALLRAGCWLQKREAREDWAVLKADAEALRQAVLLVWSVHSIGLKVGVFGVQRGVVSHPAQSPMIKSLQFSWLPIYWSTGFNIEGDSSLILLKTSENVFVERINAFFLAFLGLIRVIRSRCDRYSPECILINLPNLLDSDTVV